MSFKRFIVVGLLPSLLAGCAGIFGTQSPAPVYDGQPQAQKSSPDTAKQEIPPKSVVKTRPLKDSLRIKSEPLPAPESLSIESQPSDPQVSETAPLETMEPPPRPELTPFAPIEPTVRLSPVVNALVLAANQNTQAGDIESAAASIERAIRIEPRNATLFYKLALLRLKQSKPRLAEDLAKKSALLASTDNTLKKHCWLLIAHARELQQDFAGAKEAKIKADGF